MRSRGITRAMAPGIARRDVDISDDTHRTWFLSLEEGIDTVVSAAASNANAWKTTSSPGARQKLYERHFKTYIESKAAAKSPDAFSGEWSLREVVAKLAMEAGWRNHAPPSGSLRFVICGYCGQSTFAGSQWGHLCPAVKALVEDDGVDTGLGRNRLHLETEFTGGRSSSHPNAGTLSIAQGGRAGRVYEFKTRNQMYGFVVIPLYFANCVLDLDDVAEVELSDEDLDKLDLMWWDPNPALREWRNEGKFSQFLHGDHRVGRQIIDKRASNSWRETVAVAAHIRCSRVESGIKIGRCLHRRVVVEGDRRQNVGSLVGIGAHLRGRSVSRNNSDTNIWRDLDNLPIIQPEVVPPLDHFPPPS